MPNAPVINNPYVLVNDERRTATLVKNRGRVLNELLHDHETLVTKLGNTLNEMGDTFDLNKITSITGGAGDKVEAIINMHSDLAGLDGAIGEIRAIEAARTKASDGGLDNYLEQHGLTIDSNQLQSPFNPYGDRVVDAATQIIMDAQRRGLKLRQAEAAVQTYEVDMVKANIFATLFRRGAAGGDGTSGWPTEDLRMPGMLIDSIQRPVQVTDIFNVIRTEQAAVKYMQEVTFTNAVTEIAETMNPDTPGDTPAQRIAAQGYYPESALKVMEQIENIYKLGTHIPVTQEQLDDVGFVRAYLNRRIPFMMRQTIDARLLGSESTAPASGQIIGLLHRGIIKVGHAEALGFERQGNAGTIDDGEKVTTANFKKPLNTLLQAKAKVMFVAYGMPSHCIMHPNIWVVMATQESESGGYYLGNPANEFVPRVWGMPIVQAQTGVSDVSSKGNSAATGTRYGALVGDFNNWTDLVVRKDMEVQVGVINVDFLLDVLRIKASTRLGLLLYRPEAFVAIENPRSV